MTPTSENQPARRNRHEKALEAFLEERRAAGNPCTEEEIREHSRLFQKLGYPTLEVTPEGWATEALRLIEARAGSESPDAAPAISGSPEKRVRDALSDVVRDTTDTVHDLLGAIRGVVIFDTAWKPLSGVRSAPSQPRQILIAYPTGRLYLQMERKDDRLDLTGQFIPTDRSGLPERRTAQVSSGTDSQEVTLPENGEFRFELPFQASLDLRLHWGETSLIERVQS